MCPSMPGSSSFAFPSDGYRANGLRVSGAQTYSGAPRRLTIWGGTITSIQGPTHAGSVNGNSTANFLVRFKSTGSAVLLAWGGHLAQSAYWDKANGGAPDGAAQVSGAPWHMRTLQLDGAGNKNQDRSIQPSAIVGRAGTSGPGAGDTSPDRTPHAGRTAGDAAPHRAPDPSRAAGDAATDHQPAGRRWRWRWWHRGPRFPGRSGDGVAAADATGDQHGRQPRGTPSGWRRRRRSRGGDARGPGRVRRAATHDPPTPPGLSPHPPTARARGGAAHHAPAHRLPSPS